MSDIAHQFIMAFLPALTVNLGLLLVAIVCLEVDLALNREES